MSNPIFQDCFFLSLPSGLVYTSDERPTQREPFSFTLRPLRDASKTAEAVGYTTKLGAIGRK